MFWITNGISHEINQLLQWIYILSFPFIQTGGDSKYPYSFTFNNTLTEINTVCCHNAIDKYLYTLSLWDVGVEIFHENLWINTMIIRWALLTPIHTHLAFTRIVHCLFSLLLTKRLFLFHSTVWCARGFFFHTFLCFSIEVVCLLCCLLYFIIFRTVCCCFWYFYRI